MHKKLDQSNCVQPFAASEITAVQFRTLKERNGDSEANPPTRTIKSKVTVKVSLAIHGATVSQTAQA
jgi:hypothetical protein